MSNLHNILAKQTLNGGYKMYGSISGNIIGTLYFLLFQIAGLLLINMFIKKEHILSRILLGSVMGSFLLQWLPILFSFFLDFTITAHLLALLPLLPIYFWGSKKIISNNSIKTELINSMTTLKRHFGILVLISLTMILWCILLNNHTILLKEDGAMHCGQCSFGDMNMHLGFITSLANQNNFPPDYSIFPGVKLSYPFLSDSISSSIYIFGTSLRLAYILPMIFAFLQIIGCVYILAYTVFHSRAKAILSWCLYLFNGGFGFLYFFDWVREPKYHFSDIFTGFYTTPTNLVENNIRWSNIIADMFLPQRATLFGYAIAFSCIYLLYRGVFGHLKSRKLYFIFAGIFLGGLPMIHTHSFLATGLISASWLLYTLYRKYSQKRQIDKQNNSSKLLTFFKKYVFTPQAIFVGYIIFMYVISFLLKKEMIPEDNLLYIACIFFGLVVCYGIGLLVWYFRNYKSKEFLKTWGIFLLCALLPALPQLLFWTFCQVSDAGGDFVRGYFNWSNQGDSYLWFYVKNIGMTFILLIGSIFANRPKAVRLIMPAGFIWFLAELIVFTPNTYDNNKLLYLAYLLICLAVADYAVELFKALKNLGSGVIMAIIILFACLISGILTLGREVISDYQVYGNNYVALAEFVEHNTDVHDVIMTGTKHNNEIAALTGRTIICGADSFLYFHGINTSERKEELRHMYEAPYDATELFQKYSVDYIVITDYERGEFNVNEFWFDNNCYLLFSNNETKLYAIND